MSFAIGVGGQALGYSDRAHQAATRAAVEVLRTADEKEGHYSDVYLQKHEEMMVAGAGNGEDSELPGEDYGHVAGNERSFRHYYDVKGGKDGTPWQDYYPLWWVIKDGHVDEPAGGYYPNALRWAHDGAGTSADNLRNWVGAIRAYDYTGSSRREAYYRLGHVIHLLQDMAEPDHVANVPHAGSSFFVQEVIPLLPSLRDANKRYGIRPFDETFEWMINEATSACGYEWLVDHLAEHPNPERRLNLTVPEEDEEIKPLRASAKVKEELALDFFFNELGKEALLEMDRAQLKVPLGLEFLTEDQLKSFKIRVLLGGLLDLKELADLKLHDRKRKWLEEVFPTVKDLPAAVPTIDPGKPRLVEPYRRLAGKVLRRSSSYGAGLLQTFHDVVCPPPYAYRVAIRQNNELRYSALWKDRHEPVRGTHDNPSDDDYKPKYDYAVVSHRELKRYEVHPLSADKEHEITIWFGPANFERDDDIAGFVSIDPKSVKVKLNDKDVRGDLQENGYIWRGYVTPSSEHEKKGCQLHIQASDLRFHYHGRDTDSPQRKQGLSLDPNPATPAKARNHGYYQWTRYEGVDGKFIDRTHRIPPANVPDPPPGMPSFNDYYYPGILAGELNPEQVKKEVQEAAHSGEALDLKASKVAIEVDEYNNIRLLGPIQYGSRLFWKAGPAPPVDLTRKNGESGKKAPKEGTPIVPSQSLFSHSADGYREQKYTFTPVPGKPNRVRQLGKQVEHRKPDPDAWFEKLRKGYTDSTPVDEEVWWGAQRLEDGTYILGVKDIKINWHLKHRTGDLPQMTLTGALDQGALAYARWKNANSTYRYEFQFAPSCRTAKLIVDGETARFENITIILDGTSKHHGKVFRDVIRREIKCAEGGPAGRGLFAGAFEYEESTVREITYQGQTRRGQPRKKNTSGKWAAQRQPDGSWLFYLPNGELDVTGGLFRIPFRLSGGR